MLQSFRPAKAQPCKLFMTITPASPGTVKVVMIALRWQVVTIQSTVNLQCLDKSKDSRFYNTLFQAALGSSEKFPGQDICYFYICHYIGAEHAVNNCQPCH